MVGGTFGFCDGTVIVHDDRSFTCSNDVCTRTASDAVLVAFHGRFVPCARVFAEGGCPRCSWHLFVALITKDRGIWTVVTGWGEEDAHEVHEVIEYKTFRCDRVGSLVEDRFGSSHGSVGTS